MRHNIWLAAVLAAALPAGDAAASSWFRRTPLDAFGDPLPSGATARFGSVRWRHPDAVTAVAISPDGGLVAASSRRGGITVWSVATGKLVHEFPGHHGQTDCVAFSPDGKFLATAGGLGFLADPASCVRVWDLVTGEQVITLDPRGGGVTFLAFNPDGTLVSAGLFQPVIVWEPMSGRRQREIAVTHWCVEYAVSPDGRRVAIAAESRGAAVYDLNTGRQRICIPGNSKPRCLEFSPDGRGLLVASGNDLRLFELATGQCRKQVELKPIQSKPSSDEQRRFVFAPDGRRVAEIGTSSDISWQDALTGAELPPWKGHTGTVRALVFSRDSTRAVSGGEDGAVRVWDTASGKVIRAPSERSSPCAALGHGADGNTVLAVIGDLHWLDAKTLEERIVTRTSSAFYRPMAFCANGKVAAVLSKDRDILIVDTGAQKIVRTLRRDNWQAWHVALSPDGKTLVAVGGAKDKGCDRYLRVWDVATGVEGKPLCADLSCPYDIAMSSLGIVAVADEFNSGSIRFWDLASGKEGPRLDWRADELLFSPDGKRLVAGFHNYGVTLWDVAGRLKLWQFDAEASYYSSCTLSPDGRKLLLGQEDGKVFAWNTATGESVRSFKAHRGSVRALSISPHDLALVTGGCDGTVLRWPAAVWRKE